MLLGCTRHLSAAIVAVAMIATTADARSDISARRRVEKAAFHSAALGSAKTYRVYLPPGYEHASDRRYPVIYLLHGLGGTSRDFFHYGGLHRTLDRLIGQGLIRAVIVVGADGGVDYWTNHVDRPTRPGARHGDAVALDLVAEIDRRFRTLPSREHRALVGVSMGGYGALSLALLHPDRFAAGVSLSGALFPEPPTHHRRYRRVWGHPPDREHFDRASPQLLMSQLTAQGGNPGLYLHCGDSDGLPFLDYARRAHRVLEARRIPHLLRISPGGHQWEVWIRQADDWLVFLDEAWGQGP